MAEAIEVRVEGVQQFRDRLAALGANAPLAVSRALNRTMVSIRRKVIRALAQEVSIRQADVAPATTLLRSTARGMTAVIRVSGRRIPLVAFGARQTAAGVTYRLSAGGRGLVPGSFLATMASGHRGVFRRKGRTRLPILELFGPSLPYVTIRRRLFQAQQAAGVALLERNLQHEIDFLLQQGRPAVTGDAA